MNKMISEDDSYLSQNYRIDISFYFSQSFIHFQTIKPHTDHRDPCFKDFPIDIFCPENPDSRDGGLSPESEEPRI